MSSNLVVLYPETQIYCTRATIGADFSTAPNEHNYHPVFNTINGPRWQIARSRNDATAQSIIYDTGPNAAHSHSFIYISKLDIMRSYGITIQLDIGGSNDATAWTDFSTYPDISALTLTGPNSQDFVMLLGGSVGPYRYYRAKFSAATPFELAVGKIFMGIQWDPGSNPDDYKLQTVFNFAPSFITGGGSHLLGRSDQPRLQLSIDWINVSNTNTNTFFSDIYAYREKRIFVLYALAYTDILNGETLLPVMLRSASTQNPDKKTNTNRIHTEWVEVIG